MVVRGISGVFLLIILGVTLTMGGPVLFVFDLAIALIGYMEMVRATKVRDKENKLCLMEFAGYLGIAAYFGVLWMADTDKYIMLTIIMTIMAMLLVYVFKFPKYGAAQVMACVFSFIYAPIMLSYIYMTRNLEFGFYLVWLIFCASWACDTAAYCVGMLIGKHKLAPVLSPKKSIEGAVGGVLGAALAGYIYAFCLLRNPDFVMSSEIIWAFPLISAMGSILSQLGDLAASGIKRNFEIKDYGKLIPGHGGIMDRFDSVCVTAPLIYYMSLIILGVN